MSLHLNRPCRCRAPFWTRPGASTPAEAKEVRNQIESNDQASEYLELNLRALRGHHDPLVETISRCTVDEPCAQILCSHCARRYRLWLGSELIHLAANGPPAFVATILLEAAQGPALSNVDPRLLHGRVRKQLTRAGIEAAIGGTEASYRAKENRWIVHLHLLVFGTLKNTAVTLREIFAGSGLGRPVVCQSLKNRAAQISYLQKFQTCHRPGEAGFSGRGRAYPMKTQQINQLAQWTERRRFEDFLFVLGLRRRGSRFEPEHGFNQALFEDQSGSLVGGDGGDGGDDPNRHTRNISALSALPMSSVTPSNIKSDQLYRHPRLKTANSRRQEPSGARNSPSSIPHRRHQIAAMIKSPFSPVVTADLD
jgi:hypothetical protein